MQQLMAGRACGTAVLKDEDELYKLGNSLGGTSPVTVSVVSIAWCPNKKSLHIKLA